MALWISRTEHMDPFYTPNPSKNCVIILTITRLFISCDNLCDETDVDVVFQERTGSNAFDHDSLRLQYKLDNEFELVFVVAYQKILQLSYVDKFLNDIHLEFRDRYKNELQRSQLFHQFNFKDNYDAVLATAEKWGKNQAKLPKQMRTFDESFKSKKTVASMIERKDDKDNKKQGKLNFIFRNKSQALEIRSNRIIIILLN